MATHWIEQNQLDTTASKAPKAPRLPELAYFRGQVQPDSEVRLAASAKQSATSMQSSPVPSHAIGEYPPAF